MTTLDFLFLDVGQGDGTLIECPNEKFVLVDLGSKKNAGIAGADAVDMVYEVLRSNKKDYIDYLFLTHGDGDHYNLIPTLAEKGIKFKYVFFGGKVGDYPTYLRKYLAASANSSGFCTDLAPANNLTGKGTSAYASGYHGKIKIGKYADDDIGMDLDVDLTVLAANVQNQNAVGYRKNLGSLVLRFEYCDFVAILMGDAEPDTESYIMNMWTEDFLQADVLKLAHHGSKHSNTERWLHVVNPKIVVASGDQKWGHPDVETMDRVRNIEKSRLNKEMYEHGYVMGKWIKSKRDYNWYVENGQDAILTNLYRIKGKMGGEGWKAHGVAYRVQFGDGFLAVSDTLENETQLERSKRSKILISKKTRDKKLPKEKDNISIIPCTKSVIDRSAYESLDDNIMVDSEDESYTPDNMDCDENETEAELMTTKEAMLSKLLYTRAQSNWFTKNISSAIKPGVDTTAEEFKVGDDIEPVPRKTIKKK